MRLPCSNLRERIVFGGAGGMIRKMDRVMKELRECPKIAWEAAKTFSEIDGEQRAASFAYYALFSLVPLFALMLSAGSSYFDSQEVIHTVERYFPIGEPQQDFMWEMVASLEKSRGSVTIVSFVILIWSSLRFFQALVRGVNRAWHTVEIPWWQLPLKNLLMLAVMASALLIGLLAPALLQGAKNIAIAFQDFLKSQIPALNLDMLVGIFDLARYALSGAVLFYSFTLLYMLAPRRRVFFRQVWIPALLVMFALQVCQNAFVNYLPRFVNYNAIYGSVGVMMLLMLWVYITGVVIFLGACFCSAAAKIHGAENAGTG
jgi:membrane protein